MHRFFIPPSWIRGNRVTITGPQAHQIANVLRMRSGELIAVLDNSGWVIEVQLTSVDGNAVNGEVQRRRLSAREPRTKVSLYQGVLRSNRFEFVLQKGTELGVVEFVPVIADRCVMSDLGCREEAPPLGDDHPGGLRAVAAGPETRATLHCPLPAGLRTSEALGGSIAHSLGGGRQDLPS